MRALNRKLVRDIRHMRWQVLTIALVVAAGVASYVAVRGTYESLMRARASYYDRERFADVFVRCERAPTATVSTLAAIPGVSRVYARIVERALLPMSDLPEPAAATLISIPDDGVPPLVGVVVIDGRLPDPARSDEALLLEGFARHHAIHPGDSLEVVVNGVLREVRVSGLAMSPEFVMAADMAGGGRDDRFAVLWMPRHVLAAAYELEGAFDDAVFTLAPGASEGEVLLGIDRALERYGGKGAFPRRRQLSANVVESTMASLESMARVVPLIFLAVAAFLLHVALTRIVELQRGEIAILRALGYRASEVSAHYLALASVIAVTGAALGLALGRYLGGGYAGLILEVFRFPDERFRLTASVVATALAVSLGTAFLGGLATARRVAALPPADAMRPASPEVYRRSWLSFLGAPRWFEMAGRMVIREAERRPGRLLLSAFGIALSVAILVAGRFRADAVTFLIETIFERGMREDVSLVFVRPAPGSVLSELEHLPGVHLAEGYRQVEVRVRVGHLHRDVQLDGRPSDLRLRRLMDVDGSEVSVPSDGVAITSKLGELLGVGVGDSLDVEVLSGDHRRGPLRVTALVPEMFGLSGHMSESALAAFLHEEPRIDVALLRVDPRHLPELRHRIASFPGIGAVVRRAAIIQGFHEQMGRMMNVMTAILTLFASVIAVGVVYNNARVALSMKARDLATLRVLGFSRREVGAVLFGEISLQLVLGIPLGLLVGRVMAAGISRMADPERYRFPEVISAGTYAFAALVVLATTLATWAVFRGRLRRLDLVAVLKTRD